MRIAIPYAGEEIFGKFDRAKQFMLYDVEAGAIVKSMSIAAGETGEDSLCEFLSLCAVNTVICSGINASSVKKLLARGIICYPGCHGKPELACKALAENRLEYRLENIGQTSHDHCQKGCNDCGDCDDCSGCHHEEE